MGWSRQAYYQQIKAEAALHERDAQVVELVREVRRRQPRIGVRKLHHMLRRRLAAKHIKLGRDGMFATLKRAHLLVPTARAYHKTTDSFHRFYKHPNLLKPGLNTPDIHRPEQVWVADITLSRPEIGHQTLPYSGRARWQTEPDTVQGGECAAVRALQARANAATRRLWQSKTHLFRDECFVWLRRYG